MSFVVVPRNLTFQVQIWDDSTIEVNMVRLTAQTHDAEFYAKTGMHLPGVNKLKPTVKALCEEYHFDHDIVKTWADVALCLRSFKDDLDEQLVKS